MKDGEIVGLFLERSEAAIREAEGKYGRYCRAIAMRILGDELDAAEVVSDTWLGAWNSIPPHEPENLAGYLGKLTRQNAIKRWRKKNAVKRGGETAVALEELASVVSPEGDPVEKVEAGELAGAMNRFVEGLPTAERRVFVCRYWHLDTIGDIAGRFGYSESKVKSMLSRTRNRLRKFLIGEGFIDGR